MGATAASPMWVMSYQRGRRMCDGSAHVIAGSTLSRDEHPILKIERWNARAKGEAERDGLPVETFVLLWYREIFGSEQDLLEDVADRPCDHEMYLT